MYWNKAYDFITFVYDVTNKILWGESNYIVDLVMWPKFFNSNISMREVIIISILQGFDQKNHFEGSSLSRFNHFGLALRIALKFYTSVAKRLNLKIRKFWGLIAVFKRYWGKTGRGTFCPPASWIGLMNGRRFVKKSRRKRKYLGIYYVFRSMKTLVDNFFFRFDVFLSKCFSLPSSFLSSEEFPNNFC